jgi:hypothetical protein
MTPDDADLVAKRVVARLARLIAGIVVTLVALWILPLLLLYTLRSQSPAGLTGPSVVISIVTVAAVAVVVVVIVRFWSRVLRGSR